MKQVFLASGSAIWYLLFNFGCCRTGLEHRFWTWLGLHRCVPPVVPGRISRIIRRALLFGALLLIAPSSVYAAQINPSIKVRLFSQQHLNEVTLHGYGGLRASGQRVQGALMLAVENDQVVAYDRAGLRIVKPAISIASRSGRWIDLETDEGTSRRTVGWLNVSVKDGRLFIINILPLETYVLGIVNGELGSLQFNYESLKAQIVASRSYVLASLGRHHTYDFCDGPHCQVYDGTASIRPDFKLAMQVSRGEYLSYHGHPIPAFFHDSCGGHTAAVETVWKKSSPVPYLQGVQDDDGEEAAYCRNAPLAHWSFYASRQDLRDCFYRKGWIKGYDALDTLKVVQLDESDRAHYVLIQTAHPRWLPATEVRKVVIRYFGTEVLRSTVFEITRDHDGFRFDGRGWGHGVGLCQWGAIEMGKEGKNYREILAHYYPGTKIDRLPEEMYVSADQRPADVQ